MEKIAFLASPMIFNSLKVNDELVSGPFDFFRKTHMNFNYICSKT